MNWLDKIPMGALSIAAVLMLLAPFTPEPHLVQKFNMLMDGSLSRPIDIFDVFWHLLPATLLGLKLIRNARSRSVD